MKKISLVFALFCAMFFFAACCATAVQKNALRLIPATPADTLFAKATAQDGTLTIAKELLSIPAMTTAIPVILPIPEMTTTTPILRTLQLIRHVQLRVHSGATVI